jgi:hypothetical protein
MILKSYKILLMTIVVVYAINNFEKPKKLYNDFLEKFQIRYYLNESSNYINKNINKVITENKHDIPLVEQQMSIEDELNNLDEDLFCNKKSEKLDEDILRNICLIKKQPISTDILKPINQVAYNFEDNFDNNILYTLNPIYKNNKLKHEKELYGSIAPKNARIIHSNFDKQIDNFKLFNTNTTILNIKNKTNIDKPCFVKVPENIPQELKLFSRIMKNEIILNWNIPILPIGYYPDNIVIKLSKNNKKKFKMYSIKYNSTSCKFENDLFEIFTLRYEDRISFTLKTPRNKWYNKHKNKIVLIGKIYFFFAFNDHSRNLKKCYLESNFSHILQN